MLNGTLISTIMGFGVGGLGIGLGGLVACVLGRQYEKLLGLMLAITAGMIFSLLLSDLLPSSIEVGGEITTFLGIGAGFVLIHKIEYAFEKIVIITGDSQNSLFIRSGLLLALGVAIHNFPVGLAMGAGMFNEPQVGLNLATTMLLHNFPEGLAISLPMVFADVNRIFVPVMSSIVAIPSGVGSFVGYNMGNINPNILSLLFGIAIGAIFYVTWFEIARRAVKHLFLVSFFVYLGIGALIGSFFSLLR